MPNCPGAKLSGAKLSGAKLSYHHIVQICTMESFQRVTHPSSLPLALTRLEKEVVGDHDDDEDDDDGDSEEQMKSSLAGGVDEDKR